MDEEIVLSQPSIVQFQHRYDEISVCVQDSRRKDIFPVPWNTGDHRRRLIGHYGKYVSAGSEYEGELAFWTEWEANTRAKNLKHLGNDLCAKRMNFVAPFARSLRQNQSYQGCVRVSGSAYMKKGCGMYLNTDPCVFGSSFKYSNCRQDKTPRLKHLAPGSLIVFCSVHKGLYILDTVFIVADNSTSYKSSKTGIKVIKCSAEFRVLTLERLISNHPSDYVFYRGVKYKKGITSPFSFTPAYKFSSTNREDDMYWKEAESSRCRKRCIINLDRLNVVAQKHNVVNPFGISRTRSATLSSAGLDCIKAVWAEIVRQVQDEDELDNNMVLGVHFKEYR